MDNFIDVGQIVNTHGLRGEVKVNPRTDAPEVFEVFEILCTEDGKEYKVESVRYQKNCVLLKLSGVNNMTEAEKILAEEEANPGTYTQETIDAIQNAYDNALENAFTRARYSSGRY